MNTVQEEVRSGLADIVNEIVGVPLDEVRPEQSFADDLDVDSLSMVEVVVAAEERFGLTIPDQAAAGMKTVGDAIGYIVANR
ncbi:MULTISPECIES: acyl carrier protein [Streptomyces]|jgi:acyl carrier protein|uniref:Acyl carrier protein n=1 Tax=Streptomyces griseorubiginosus TaxID=67304 RepID=A0A117PFJ9_9ACTN|nr:MULTISPECIES: acyl carrier protein [Streptomyces]AYC37736.1 Meromycolate extension acyl carrier protein [Streptomyces griseorubiginosus]KUM78679.1 acyl carrier protein [Streptomyces griseorubiginosus]KUN66860.1 acyl carrier protein [Streptomyces griseorubiginosus]TCR22732.1 acyl carrier protein [Streptomyces sp. BK205]